MKKISRLLILLLVAFVPFAVKADMGAPVIKPYKVTVVDPSGLDYKEGHYDDSKKKWVDETKHFDQGAVFYVFYEYDDTMRCSKTEKASDTSFDINVSDKDKIKPVDTEFVPTDTNLGEYGQANKKYTDVVTNSEVELKKGPSVAYETITRIPKDTKLSYKYEIGDPTVYIYVEYNGQKGWVNVLDKTVLFSYNQKMVTFYDVNTNCGTITAGTIWTAKYITDEWTRNVTYEKDGCVALVNNFKSEVIAPIRNYEKPSIYKTNKDIIIYSKAGNKGDKITTMKKGSTFKILALPEINDYSYDYYIDYNGTTGFIYAGENDFDYLKDDDKTTTTTTEATTEETTTTEEETTEATNSDEPTNSKISVNKTRNIIIISVIVGVALAVTAIVVIILVNKKKKVEPTEEVKPVEPEPVMTSNDLNLVQEKAEEETTVDETEENKEDAE